MLRILVVLLLVSISSYVFAQRSDSPTGTLSTPQEAAFQFIYYLDAEHYNLDSSAMALVGPNRKITEEARDLTTKLKQILDGRGLKVMVNLIPDAPTYIDSSSQNPVYVLFPNDLPNIYVIRQDLSTDKSKKVYADHWQFSPETVDHIEELHRQVYPLGSHYLLDILSKQSSITILGLDMWQYLGVLIILALGFLLNILVWRLFNIIFSVLANTRLGRGHFEPELVSKISKTVSYLCIAYFIHAFIPILMLPISLSYYIFLGIKLYGTVFSVILVLHIIELGRSYFEKIVEQTESESDDQLLPIFIKILRTLAIIGGLINALAAFGVDLTALIAGLSIGGLAIALAAQETVKNLIGSIMIYADKPFKIGDFINSGEITGTVEEIGFRSTRIRTPDSSLISVPNGSLVDMVINNHGDRHFRRYSTTIGVAYYTPPSLIREFIEGLRKINEVHPSTNTGTSFIHLNNMGGSSLDILFIVYFSTTDWAEDLKIREDIIFNIIELAEALNVHIAFPSTSVYVESTPEKSSIPNYTEQERQAANKRAENMLNRLKDTYKEGLPPQQS
jgi:MscS family membrane protein